MVEIDTHTAWTILLVLCIGSFVIVMLLVALTPSWRGSRIQHQESQRNVLTVPSNGPFGYDNDL
jgi:hypothetical protein